MIEYKDTYSHHVMLEVDLYISLVVLQAPSHGREGPQIDVRALIQQQLSHQLACPRAKRDTPLPMRRGYIRIRHPRDRT